MCKAGHHLVRHRSHTETPVACLTHAVLCSSVNVSGEEGSTGWITTELQVLAPVSCAINPWVHYLSRALIRSAYYF